MTGDAQHSWFWDDFLGDETSTGMGRLIGVIVLYILVVGTIFWALG